MRPRRPLQFHHHVRNLNILLRLIFGRNLEDDVLLMLRNGLLADVLDQLAHPGISLVQTHTLRIQT